MVLGKRLKGEFKKVSEAIRKLTDAQLQTLRKSGEIEVLGHKLGEDDLRLMFSLADKGNDKSHYEAHSDNEVCRWFAIFLCFLFVQGGLKKNNKKHCFL